MTKSYSAPSHGAPGMVVPATLRRAPLIFALLPLPAVAWSDLNSLLWNIIYVFIAIGALTGVVAALIVIVVARGGNRARPRISPASNAIDSGQGKPRGRRTLAVAAGGYVALAIGLWVMWMAASEKLIHPIFELVALFGGGAFMIGSLSTFAVMAAKSTARRSRPGS